MPVEAAGTMIFHTLRFYLFFKIPVSESSFCKSKPCR